MSERAYGYTSGQPSQPPNYRRVVSTLSNEEIVDELMLRRGSDGYLEALEAEAEMRDIPFTPRAASRPTDR